MTRTFLLVVLGCMTAGLAAAAPVELHYFWAATCPDCVAMKSFLADLAAVSRELRIVDHEVAFSGEGFQLMAAVAKAYGLERYATPLVAVGDVATTGIGLAVELRIAEEVARCAREGCPSPLARLPAAPRWRLSPLQLTLIVIAAVGVIAILWQLLAR